ncbi:MAG: metallophosphoesterase [Thermoplasmatota archaeon]
MKHLRVLALAALLMTIALAGCLNTDSSPAGTVDEAPGAENVEEPTQNPDMPEAPPEEPPILEVPTATNVTRFIAVGDTGTGKEAQYAVAAAMEQVCAERGCDFILSLGDNIYESGVKDPYDPQFISKFEDPYANLTQPWYLVLGNHDNSMDPLTGGPCGDPCDTGFGHWYEAGNHEVAYSYRTDRESDKWHLPARYYGLVANNVSLFGIDSSTLMFYGLGFPPTDYTYQQQESWMESAIAAADTPWKIAFAHHPYVSNGQHGNAGQYECNNTEYVPTNLCGFDYYAPALSGQYVKEFYEEHLCGKVDFIMTGHDHDLQWLAPVESCGGTEFIVSGAGAKQRDLSDETRNEAFFQEGEVYGFFWFELRQETFTGMAYSETGEMLYERTVAKPL